MAKGKNTHPKLTRHKAVRPIVIRDSTQRTVTERMLTEAYIASNPIPVYVDRNALARYLDKFRSETIIK